MKKIFKEEFVNYGFQFEVEHNLLTIKNLATDKFFILNIKEIKRLEKAIEYLKTTHSVECTNSGEGK